MMQMLSNRIPRWAAVVVLPLLATAAQASFHLFVIDQIYSDASGVVQYVELSTPATGQQFLAGNSMALIQGALGSGAARNTAALIEAYLATCIAGPGATCVIP